MNLRRGRIVGILDFQTAVEEIFDVQLLTGLRFPEVIGFQKESVGHMYDACFIPRSSYVTGDIGVHEIAWAGEELWIVSTRFSCFCTFDHDYSFISRWRPPFVTALVAEDRCHLNGLAMVDGKPGYVTVLGTTNSAGGWRADKPHSGCIIDAASGEFITRGLSMPHSPRWHEANCGCCNRGVTKSALRSTALQRLLHLLGHRRENALDSGKIYRLHQMVVKARFPRATTIRLLPVTRERDEQGVFQSRFAANPFGYFVAVDDRPRRIRRTETWWLANWSSAAPDAG